MTAVKENGLRISELAHLVSPPLDSTLIRQLLSEYQSLENRYVLGDWEPATLDAGQLSEAAARIVYHQDSGVVDHKRGLHECLCYLEDSDRNGQTLKSPNRHAFPDRKAALELAKVIRQVYRFRSRRGAVHITPDYTANQLDSQMVLASSRWIVSELLRIFLISDPSQVANIVRAMLRLEIPVVADYGGRKMVQRTGLSAQEEVLLLLHHAGASGSRYTELVMDAVVSRTSVARALSALQSTRNREVVKVGETYRITDLGLRRVVEDILAKL